MTPRLIFVGIIAAALCCAAGRVMFEVASVKMSQAPDAAVFISAGVVTPGGRMAVPSVGGNVHINNWSLAMCVAAAWGLDLNQVSGLPWMGVDRYDIAAKTSAQATQADLRLMLQALLVERFRLAAHRETKDQSAYALVAGKNGAKLHASDGDQQLPVIFAPPSRLIGHGSTMQGLAIVLRRVAGRPVVDKTGLNGTFDFTLTYSQEEAAGGSGPSIFTALQEQLGLRLEPLKSSQDVLVVDHAERIPTAN